MEPGYRILEHPADLGIEAWGATFSEALSMAVSGLVSILVDPATVEATDQRPVNVAAKDSEALVVKLLSEVLFLFDGMRFVPKSLTINGEPATTVQGFVSGEPLREGKHNLRLDVKAITYHQLAIHRRPSGIALTVFLDT